MTIPVFTPRQRALSDVQHNAFLAPIALWALALLLLYFGGYAPVALLLCYPVAIFHATLSAYWGTRVLRRWGRGEIDGKEADDAVLDVSQILLVSAASPAIVFLANDPLALSAWSTAAGIGIVCVICWFAVSTVIRLPHSSARILALGLANAALPLNASGAMTVGAFLGLFQQLVPGMT